MEQREIFLRFGVALALGVLIGIERGWHSRMEPEGTRVAGIRTFGIIALLGALSGLLAERMGPPILGFSFAAVAGVMIIARITAARQTPDYGVTTVMSALVSFALGAVAVYGNLEIAAASAVAVTMLLGAKPALHGWLKRIEYDELLAALKLLVMTLVLLPVLPDRGYGPWQALNPYKLWLMVILIAGISFVGYVAIRALGARRGIVLVGLAGGLASSTATTLGLARIYRKNQENLKFVAAGIAVSSATMFPRMALITWAVAPTVAGMIALPLGLATAVGYLGAAILWVSAGHKETPAKLDLKNPFEFNTALQFGGLLAVILVLSRALQEWFGTAGLFALSAASGLADVDAITLSLSQMTGETITARSAAVGITIAAVVNTLVKLGLAAVAGNRALGTALAATMVGTAIAAGGGLYLALVVLA